MNYTKDQINDMLDNLKPKKNTETLAGSSHLASSYYMCLITPWEDNGLVCEDHL